MKKIFRTTSILMLAAVVGTSAFSLDMGGQTVDVAVDAAINSRYVWRGITLTDEPVLQPGVTAGFKNLSFNIWGNMDLTDTNDNEMELNELDYTVDYSFAYEAFSFSAGVVQYTFPNTDFDSTTEIYIGAGYDMVGSPSLTLYQDVGESEGLYGSLGGGYSIPVSDITSIDIGGALGFGTSDNNIFYYGADTSGLTDLLVGVSSTFALGEMFSATPAVGFTTILNGDIKDLYDLSDTDISTFTVGVTFSGAF